MSICATISSSIGPGTGHDARWTLSGAPGSMGATRYEYSDSARNGMNGASSRVAPLRHSYSVRNAALASGLADVPQNRSRDKRTYQLESPSTNASISRPAACALYCSRCDVTFLTVELNAESAHRSMSERCSSGTSSGTPTDSAFAYITKNLAVFQIVLMKPRAPSATSSVDTRFTAPGALPVKKYQRSASAPSVSKME